MPENLYYTVYRTPKPFSDLLLESDGSFLVSVSFLKGKEEKKHCLLSDSDPILEKTKEWLDLYFKGKQPEFLPPFHLDHSTPFQSEVYQILLSVPYGKTITYYEIAEMIAENRGTKRMSSQAVGYAVSKNPLCLLVPCHRVIGTDGRMVGYAGGIENKIALLEQEGISVDPKEKKKYGMRCSWCNDKNPLYVRYHDEEWGKMKTEDRDLFEALSLEILQTGLSFECVLNKRENLRKAFDVFEPEKVGEFDAGKVDELMKNPGIIRNRKKIEAIIQNAKVFLMIRKDDGSFFSYLKGYTEGKKLDGIEKGSLDLSLMISEDLKHRGMLFVGSSVIHSFLEAIGIISSHEKQCFLYR